MRRSHCHRWRQDTVADEPASERQFIALSGELGGGNTEHGRGNLAENGRNNGRGADASTKIAPMSWLTSSSAASFFVSFVASMPASPSKNAPVKTRENECGSELSAVAGAMVGSVSGSR